MSDSLRTSAPTYRVSGASALLRTSSVLVATHDDHLARALESCLSPRGFAVPRAVTGYQALAFARRRAPHAIITDMLLPELGGVSMCQALREDAELGRLVPIAVVSDEPLGRETRQRLCEAGAWLVANVPLDLPSLLAQIATFIAATRQAEDRARAGIFEAASGHYSALGLARRAREVGADASRRSAPLAGVALVARPSAGGARGVPSSAASDRLAELLHRQGRAADVIARVSEHEFRLLAPATDAVGARRLIERLGQAAATSNAQNPDAEAIEVVGGYSASVELGSEPPDAAELLREASMALRVATEAGDGVRAFGDAARQ
ncbi:MAG: response regulator [Gemmatimonadaceae bacterium]